MSLTFKDIEAVGGYLFKDHGFRNHDMAGADIYRNSEHRLEVHEGRM